MSLSRRSFIHVSLATLLAASTLRLPLSLAWAQGKTGTLPIMQGATGAESTQVSIVTLKRKLVTATLREAGETRSRVEPFDRRVLERPESEYAVQNFTFTELRPATRYVLEVRDSSGKVVDERVLRTFDPEKKALRWGFFSCVRDLQFQAEQKAAWTELVSHKPDFVICVGDNVYADDGKTLPGESVPSKMFRRWVEARQAFEFFKMKELVPYLATWDDHDFGQNDTGGDFPHKREAMEIFNAFFPQDSIPGFYESGPGVASVMMLGGQRFFLLDDRTWRSKKGVDPQTHWGPEQERWLLDRLDDSSEPAWLLNGSQFYGGYSPGESYEREHPLSFRAMINSLRAVRAPVIFGSGDRHLSELMRIEKTELGYETYEITSSGMLTKTTAGRWLIFPNKRQMDGNDKHRTYNIIESTAQPGGVKLKVSCFKPKKELSYAYNLTVKKPR